MLRKLRHGKSAGFAGIGAQNSGAAGVCDDGDSSAGYQWLIVQNSRNIKHLIERFGADYACLPKQCIYGDITGSECCCVRACGATPGESASGFDCDNGFNSPDPAGDTRESTWIAKRLEIEKD